MTSPSRDSCPDRAGAIWQFTVGVALCGAAAYMVHLINWWSTRGVHAFLKDLFVVLNQHGGKWVLAGLIALLGLAFCRAALRRLAIVRARQRFAEGVMSLESAQWVRGEHSASASGGPEA